MSEEEVEVVDVQPEPNTTFVRPGAVSLKRQKRPARHLRVMYRGSQVGIVKDTKPDTIFFTGAVYEHEFQEIMSDFKVFRDGEEVFDLHPPQMNGSDGSGKRAKGSDDFNF